ncbi:hypothetical protein DQ04_19951000, partial [Trypanosoma grayi]|uniref:hypothetical protein n=1 Tax=Trypanosoma grayi TaxID=71804 RepID=UPI0004F4AD48
MNTVTVQQPKKAALQSPHQPDAASAANATTDAFPKKKASTESSVSVLVEPTQLFFPPPHRNRAVQNTIVLYNTGTLPCVFKIKAQTPHRYFTKPNIGTISANGAVRLRFILRPQKDNLPPTTCDRFRLCVSPIPASLLAQRPKLLREKR